MQRARLVPEKRAQSFQRHSTLPIEPSSASSAWMQSVQLRQNQHTPQSTSQLTILLKNNLKKYPQTRENLIPQTKPSSETVAGAENSSKALVRSLFSPHKTHNKST
jgi:hypothetical protein